MGFDIPCPAFVCEGIGDNSISKGFNYREDITYTVAFIAGGGFGCDPINTSFFYGTSVCSEVCTSMMQQLCGVMKAGMRLLTRMPESFVPAVTPPLRR